MEKRLDYGRVSDWEKLDDGRLRVKASVSRVGTLDYRLPDGSTQTEHLTADELFKPTSLETAGLAPVTLGHPEVGMVTPANWRKYSVGATGSKVEARKHDGLVDVVFVVGDEEAIAAIEEDGIREVSAGYTTELRSDGEKLYQTDRKYNHFALVKRGRAGETVRLHLDGAPDWGVQIVERNDESESARNSEPNQRTNDSQHKETSPMAKYRGLDMSDETMKLVQDMEGQIESLKTDMEKMKTDMGHSKKKDEADAATVTQLTEARIKADARADAAEMKLKDLESKFEGKMDAAQVETEIKARLDAWSKAMPFLGKDATFDSSDSVLGIQLKAIAKQRPELNLDELKGKYGDDFPVYVQATFDALETPKSEAKSEATQNSDAYDEAIKRAKVGGDRSGSSVDTREDADEQAKYDAAMKAIADAYEDAHKEGSK
ncbi:MAG: DUF2213 domain-containing protein [Cyanobacteria bacterium J06627_8]